MQTVSTTYNSISRTVDNLSDVPPFPSVSTILLNFPTTHSKIIQEFKTHLRTHPVPPNKKRVAVIDSITSNPGMFLPWREMVQICKDEGVWSVIDAAHSIGQEVNLDLEKIAPDFWVSVSLLYLKIFHVVDKCYYYRIVINGCPANAHARFYMFPNGRKIYGIIFMSNGLFLMSWICFRNQHIIKTSIPTSHSYISPINRKAPNFVEQFECTSVFI